MSNIEENVQDQRLAHRINIRQPKPLVFGKNMAQEWKTWKVSYNWYSKAIQLDKEPPEVQVATFMTTIGYEAEEIFESFNLTEDQQTNMQVIMEKFNNYFVPKVNETYEAYVFHKIVQEADENFEQFLIRITTQARKCNFGELEKRMLKDKIVSGIKDDRLRERLLGTTDLTYDRTVQMCQASELAHKQASDMSKNNESQLSVAVVKKKTQTKKNSDHFDCKRCGTKHGKRSCPAYKKKCNTCGKLGHFEVCCRSKKKIHVVHNLKDDEASSQSSNSSDTMYIGSITVPSKEEDWMELIKVGNKAFHAKLDSGAQCNVLPLHIIEKLGVIGEIKQSEVKKLVTFSDHKLSVIGELKLKCRIKHRNTELKFLIVKEKVQPIIGKKTCEEEKLLVRVQSVKINPKLDEKQIFNGLGCFKGYEYDIDLVENPSFEICPARTIPLAIKETVKQELDKMVKMDVIKPVTKPTAAVSPLVIVKKGDKIRLCIDPTNVNKNIKRRHFPLNTIEAIAARIAGSKYFTRLDCTRGFWQIRVTERTQEYLTFATPWGRYSCKRLPFGLSSAPEVFQQIMSEVLQDIPNVECAMDDILIHAGTEQKLRDITETVLRRLHENGLKLNKEKCLFNVQRINFWATSYQTKDLK